MGNLGVVYGQRGELERAERHYKQALRIAQEMGYKAVEASLIANLGLVAGKRNEVEQAKDLLRQALAIYEEIGAKQQIEQTRGNLASILAWIQEEKDRDL